ncbi:electron transfer flavoprotein alpha subunit [Streptomyces sp. V3I8]|uniref:mycofactocin-associated electron transfer flavoprotein alpha subunit n=1 Tax=Streptomyces sp. V3I8 TaxID=3042279 RepID=UPI002786C1AA|nr:mycofactocin-associated electron transfer flavoprotein alpha subunit [Streptomyces sp. V3I8]MDQ1041721.1 electron transfer flavoprotein alpha subunit [Streptomyces sp. V3I8]
MSGGALPARDAVAVIVVRGGELPQGAAESAAEAGAGALLVGDGVQEARGRLDSARTVWALEAASLPDPGVLAAVLAPLLARVHTVVLPASPDGRDLAPRLAAALGRVLLAGALTVTRHGAQVLRHEGRQLAELAVEGPFVATLVPGVRGAGPAGGTPVTHLVEASWPGAPAGTRALGTAAPGPGGAPLEQASRVLGAGAGLGDGAAVAVLAGVGRALGAAVGATRAVTDQGWLGHDRQIGTTGVVLDPDLYVAFGVSGASQHVGGLGRPRHVVSVNTDPHCPMTAMADLGIVADAPAVLAELARRLEDV